MRLSWEPLTVDVQRGLIADIRSARNDNGRVPGGLDPPGALKTVVRGSSTSPLWDDGIVPNTCTVADIYCPGLDSRLMRHLLLGCWR